jgi:hypothetical protein
MGFVPAPVPSNASDTLLGRNAGQLLLEQDVKLDPQCLCKANQ